MEIDNSWIDEYEKSEVKYNDYYKDDIKHIKIYSLLINKNLMLENIQEDSCFFEEKNILKKYQLISLINTFKNNNKHIKLLSAMKYNINLDSDNVLNYLKHDTENELFLTSLTKIDDIYFDPSIVMFEDLNCLFLIYIELNESSSNQTKRIKLQTKKRKTKKNKLK